MLCFNIFSPFTCFLFFLLLLFCVAYPKDSFVLNLPFSLFNVIELVFELRYLDLLFGKLRCPCTMYIQFFLRKHLFFQIALYGAIYKHF